MYNKKLSKIFPKESNWSDSAGYPWAFNIDKNIDKHTVDKKNKIFYAIGDSWLDSKYFNKVFLNDYPNYFLINRAIGGMSNGLIIDLLRSDVNFLKTLNIDVIFLVAFSEVGRTSQELRCVNPKEFDSTHEYFGEILKKQYNIIKKIVKDYSNFITTAFVTNNFNYNKSILDFCEGTVSSKPQNVFTVYSNGIFEFLKHRNGIFKFNFAEDVGKSLELKEFILNHKDVEIGRAHV
jgi:hypothetical protein